MTVTTSVLTGTAMIACLLVPGNAAAASAVTNSVPVTVTLSPPAAPDAAGVPPLTAQQRTRFAQIAAAIAAKRWDEARALLDRSEPVPLAAYFRAELLLAASSPRAKVSDLQPLLDTAPYLPQAARLAALAQRRGAAAIPALPAAQPLRWAGSAPLRTRTPSITNDPVSDELARTIPDRIKNDDPAGAETLLAAALDRLSPDARTEWQQRVAWSYYIENDDANALRLAAAATTGSGPWVAEAAWVEGLAAWRSGDMPRADRAFQMAARTDDAEKRAAAHYWVSRTAMTLGAMASVQPRLRAAAQDGETFYGLLAAEALAVSPAHRSPGAPRGGAGLAALADAPNVQIAVALAQLGLDSAADTVLRHQARIGSGADHPALTALAATLSLPETQLFLAHNAPAGVRPDPLVRYPAPSWQPNGGWKVDPALVFAHTLQESRFQTAVVSPAGAKGLMQVRPGTARDIARWRGDTVEVASLSNPAVNMDFGQSYLEYLSTLGATGGALPKVIAAYNAGPAPVTRWQSEIRDNGDPLLYIESIPFWETRGYVGIVLRNYWMYEVGADRPSSPSRAGLAQGQWPRFPTVQRGTVRISGVGKNSDTD